MSNGIREIFFGLIFKNCLRLRQLRVRNDSCFVPVVIQEMRRNFSKVNPSECFDYYSKSGEDRRHFGLAFNRNSTTFDPDESKATNISAWIYATEDELNGTPVSGKLASYSGAGSFQDLASDKTKSKAIIDELKQGLWISSGTRFVSLDFTLYNANINLFCIVK